ncbi:MAG: acireductone synthase [Candidatus Acidiferrales bacterium]
MSSPPDPASIRSLLLDVEGATTPISFVYEVLFPFARRRLESFLREHGEEEPVAADLRALEKLRAAEGAAAAQSLAEFARRLMDQDRKDTPLKSLQGKIWEQGYRRGELRGQVFPDVPRAFRRWRAQGRDISIFSSGSVLAQKLLFEHSEAGDLTPFLRAYFDTATGPKRDPASYRRIASSLERQPAEILFVSDVLEELDPARAAGLHTLLAVRPGNRPVSQPHHATIISFDELFA